MGGEVCYVHSTPTVIDYGIGAGAGAGADSIMLCLDTRSENLVKLPGATGYCQSAALLDVYYNVFSSIVLIFEVSGYFW